jgi:hypothetical protein
MILSDASGHREPRNAKPSQFRRTRNVFVTILVLVNLSYETHQVLNTTARNTQDAWFPALMAAVFAVLYLLAEFFLDHTMVLVKNFILLFLFFGIAFFACKEKVALYRADLEEGYRYARLLLRYKKASVDGTAAISRLYDDVSNNASVPSPWNQKMKIPCSNIGVQEDATQREIKLAGVELSKPKLGPARRDTVQRRRSLLMNRSRLLNKLANDCEQSKSARHLIAGVLQAIDRKDRPRTASELSAAINWMVDQFYKAKTAVPLTMQSRPKEMLGESSVVEDPSEFQLINWALDRRNWYTKPAEPFVSSLMFQFFFLFASKLIGFLLHCFMGEANSSAADSRALQWPKAERAA